MLNAYSKNQTVVQNGIIPFNSVSLLKGKTAVLNGVSTIDLNCRGVYCVTLDISGTPSEAGGVIVSMTKNGVTQPQAVIDIPLVVTTASVTGSISTLVQVSENNSACCCASATNLQFINTGVGLANANFTITVTKLC